MKIHSLYKSTICLATLALTVFAGNKSQAGLLVIREANYAVYSGGWFDPIGVPILDGDVMVHGTVEWVPSTFYDGMLVLSPCGEGTQWYPLRDGSTPIRPEAASNPPPHPNYTALLSCQFVVTDAGFYTFGTDSDDGSALFIDGALVVNNGGPHYQTSVFATTYLRPGLHRMEITYWENGWDGNVLAVYVPGALTPRMLKDTSGPH